MTCTSRQTTNKQSHEEWLALADGLQVKELNEDWLAVVESLQVKELNKDWLDWHS